MQQGMVTATVDPVSYQRPIERVPVHPEVLEAKVAGVNIASNAIANQDSKLILT
jgi:hypothetical protein